MLNKSHTKASLPHSGRSAQECDATDVEITYDAWAPKSIIMLLSADIKERNVILFRVILK